MTDDSKNSNAKSEQSNEKAWIGGLSFEGEITSSFIDVSFDNGSISIGIYDGVNKAVLEITSQHAEYLSHVLYQVAQESAYLAYTLKHGEIESDVNPVPNIDRPNVARAISMAQHGAISESEFISIVQMQSGGNGNTQNVK